MYCVMYKVKEKKNLYPILHTVDDGEYIEYLRCRPKVLQVDIRLIADSPLCWRKTSTP